MIIDLLQLPASATPSDPPAAHFSRQEWEDRIQRLTQSIRDGRAAPGFVLGAAEVSVHYHRPVVDFVSLVASRMK